MNIVVIGGGAIGLANAAFLARTSSLTLLVRREEQAIAINAGGITVEHPDEPTVNQSVLATTSPECISDAELVVIATKSYGTPDVAKLLSEFPATSMVVSFQNGWGQHELLIDACGKNRVVGGLTGFTGRRVSDATISVKQTRLTYLGELNGATTDRIKKVGSAFSEADIGTEVTDEIVRYVWSKFAQACCQNAMSALTGKTFGQLRESQSAVELLAELSAEMTALSKAEGVELLYNPYERLMGDWVGLDHRSSMLQDVDVGRRTEIDAINGMAVELAQKYGLSLPVNETICRLVKSLEV